MTIIDFFEKFGTSEKCLHQLADIKWGNSFNCFKAHARDKQKVMPFLSERCKIVNMKKVLLVIPDLIAENFLSKSDSDLLRMSHKKVLKANQKVVK